MKKQISIVLLGFVLTVVACVTASARTGRGIRVQIPFDFVVGEKQMRAGYYTVRRVRLDAENALLIRSEEGHGSAVVLTYAGDAPSARAFLSFRQYGERHFLAEVSIPGTASVREVPKTDHEKKAERELVAEANAGAARKVTVAGSVQ